ncbi:MAG: hypothetical protein AAF586_09875 [Planctomycetota bacterium]
MCSIDELPYQSRVLNVDPARFRFSRSISEVRMNLSRHLPFLTCLAVAAITLTHAAGQTFRTDPNGDYDVTVDYSARGDGVIQRINLPASATLNGKKLKLNSPGNIPGTGNLKLGDKVKSNDTKVNTSIKGKLKRSDVGGLNLKSGKVTVKTTRNGKLKLNVKAEGNLLSNRKTDIQLKLSGKSS